MGNDLKRKDRAISNRDGPLQIWGTFLFAWLQYLIFIRIIQMFMFLLFKYFVLNVQFFISSTELFIVSSCIAYRLHKNDFGTRKRTSWISNFCVCDSLVCCHRWEALFYIHFHEDTTPRAAKKKIKSVEIPSQGARNLTGIISLSVQ
jgi:hypothetical protein